MQQLHLEGAKCQAEQGSSSEYMYSIGDRSYCHGDATVN